MAAAAAILLFTPGRAEAYIGPGAGFALLSSFLVLFVALALTFISLLSWPVRGLFRLIRGRRAYAASAVDRVIVVGLDGLDPARAERLMDEGRLPNLSRLRRAGAFRRLQTTTPAVSPVDKCKSKSCSKMGRACARPSCSNRYSA